VTDGGESERIRPDPLPAPTPAQIAKPSETINAPSPSGQRAPDIAVSEDDEDEASGSCTTKLPDNLVQFPGPAKPARGRRKKAVEETFRVEAVKPSKGTWAFRLRWTEPDGSRPTVYVSRVDDKRFKSITERKVIYEQFKKVLIANYRMSRSVRADYSAG
jgi:hypothetical protein